MGPQLDSCGRVVILTPAGIDVELQWGRNLIVAEGNLRARHVGRLSYASMGPQLDSCGRDLRCTVTKADGTASMGPQLDSCGRELDKKIEAAVESFNGAAT